MDLHGDARSVDSDAIGRSWADPTRNAVDAIPLDGRIESLNVSVAAGLLLYEALRQRALAHA